MKFTLKYRGSLAMPSVISDNRKKADAIDDFESLFGESSTGYGSFLPADSSDPVSMGGEVAVHQSTAISREDSLKIIDDILTRKPAPISPSLPRIEPDLQALSAAPLSLQESSKPSTPIKALRNTRNVDKYTSNVNKRSKTNDTRSESPPKTVPKGKPSLSSESAERKTQKSLAKTAVNSSFDGGNKLKVIWEKMENLTSMEEISDPIEEWKGIFGSLEKTITIESAKVPPDNKLLSECTLTFAWIAEHLVGLMLRKIQTRAATSKIDIDTVLGQLAQVSALREQARQSVMKSRLYDSKEESLKCPSPYDQLSPFIQKLSKRFT